MENVVQILEIQKFAYAEQYWEREEAFVYKIQNAPDTCFGAFVNVVTDTDAGIYTNVDVRSVANARRMIGYAIALPFLITEHEVSVKLDSDHIEGIMPISNASCIYIHDVAVLPSNHYTGIGILLFEQIINIAHVHDISNLELVAVQNAATYWKNKHKFEECGVCNTADGYGTEAVKMRRSVIVS